MSRLSQAVKAKYPQYANVPDQELERRVIAMYPQYKPMASKSLGGFASNVASSAGRAASDMVGAIANPMQTLGNLGNLAMGAGQLLLPGEQGKEKYATGLARYYGDRYGVNKALKGDFSGAAQQFGDTLYNDPVGVALDASTVLGGAGGAARGLGAASKSSRLGRVGNAFSKASTMSDPFALTGSMAAKGTRNVFRGAPGKLSSQADDLLTRGLGSPSAQAKLQSRYGRSAGDFMREYNLYDRSPETLQNVTGDIIGQYDDLALNSGKQVNMGQIIQQFDDEIARLQQGVGGVVSDSDLAKVAELQRRRDQMLRAAGATFDPMGNMIAAPIATGVDTLTNFRRRVIDPDVPQSMFNLDARGSGSAKGVKRSRDIIKSAIDSSDPRLAKLGSDYGYARGLQKVFDAAEARGNNRQLFNFSKLGGAGLSGMAAATTGFMSTVPAMIGGYVAEQAVNSPRFLKGASQTLRATSKAMSSPTLSRFGRGVAGGVSAGYGATKGLRMLNPNQTSPTKPIAQKSSRPQRKSSQSQSSPTPVVAASKRPNNYEYKVAQYTSPSVNNAAFGKVKKVKRGNFY